jgi:serine/threonine protein kinase
VECAHGAQPAYARKKNATKEIRRLYKVNDTLLGSGAFGKVYLGESKENSNVKFAIKIVSIAKVTGKLREQMHEELLVLCKLDHPYVAQYIESFEDEKYLYIVMELIHGRELNARLEKGLTFTELEAAQIIYKTIEGVNHCHASGVVHRDLKPENLMVTDAGDPKIIDFGLSKDTWD